MNWEHFWDRQAIEFQQPFEQVARTGISFAEIPGMADKISEHIVHLLDIQPEDHLLDVCCGNGLLTQKLAHFCKSITAVDISAQQLNIAKRHFSRPNITYLRADVLHLSRYIQDKFDKINLYFSFQYLDNFTRGKKAVSEIMQVLQPGGLLLLGDVPDAEYLPVFYPDIQTRLKYHLARLFGRDQMGKFWKADELEKICRGLNASVQRLPQPEALPYAHYRVDYLFRKISDSQV